MTCSGMDLEGIEEDFSTRGLPPLPIQDQKALWNGRTIRVLQDVHNFLHVDKILAHISQQHTVDTHFYERVFTDLTFEDLDDAEEDEREWQLALAQPLFPANSSENLTLEQFLEQTGMIFDRQLGQYIDCKCWIMKMAHSAEKKLRKAAKKTAHFVVEHKKEIAIGVAVVVGGAALGYLGAAIVQTLLATDTASTIGGAIAAAAKAADEMNKHHDRSHDADKNLSSHASTLPPTTSNDLIKQVFGNLLPSNPIPSSHQGIYALDAENKRERDVSAAPPSFRDVPSHPFAPSSSGNIAQQFFNKVFQANPNLNL